MRVHAHRAHGARDSARSGASRKAAERVALTVAAAALLALSGCSSGSSGSSTTAGSGSAPGKVSGTVTVFAAASLTESFTALGRRFEAAHPGAEVTFSFGGSDSLASGITSGAPVDVFASASPKTMKVVTDAGAAAGAPATFARNRLEIAVPPGNPKKITSLPDLTRSGLKVALCDKEVPCGAAALKALDAAGLDLTPVSYERDVKGALTKVELKEVDASLVYATDVRSAGGTVDGVRFPEATEADGAVNDYPVALLKEAPNAEAAKAFIALVRSAEGRKVLNDAGFLSP